MTMKTIVSVATQSLVQEKARHLANATAGVAGVGATTITAVPDYLAILAPIVSILVGMFIIYKTWIDVRVKKKEETLLDIKLAKEDRRSE